MNYQPCSITYFNISNTKYINISMGKIFHITLPQSNENLKVNFKCKTSRGLFLKNEAHLNLF